jgi:GT2 family glycosyltransferase
MSHDPVDVKAIATRQAKVRLQEFLESKTLLNLARPSMPRLSVLLVLYNRAELTLGCLRSLQPYLEESAVEVVLVDNASSDETSVLLERLRGAKVIRNGDNRGFPCGVNQAAAAASGEFVLLLNNDTEVLGDSLAAAVRFLEDNGDVGAVGGRILLLDGTLQEAGCTLWREGHIFQYGRGESPRAAEYLFQRDVDYCSGAFLMTRRELFAQMGGLDEAYSPGYFEDVDYCVRLWRAGWRVVYLPDAAILHYENASSACRAEVLQLYRRNHVFFMQKHADWLPWQCSSATTSPLWARGSHDDRFKILYLPRRESAAEARALERVVRRLHGLNCFVTVYPIGAESLCSPRASRGLPADVESLPGGGLDTLSRFLTERQNYYDGVLASDEAILNQLRQYERRAGSAA